MLLKDWRTQCGSRSFVYRGSYISTVDPRFALGSIADNSCTYTFGYFLYRPSKRSQTWKIMLGFADSLQACSVFRRVMPERVVRDFKLEGAASGSGVMGPC